MSPEVVKRTQEFLFSSVEEMDAAHLQKSTQEHILRLRSIYTYWLQNPQLKEISIVSELRRRYKLGETVAYEDLRLIKICLGNLNQCTTDYYRWVFLNRAEESFEMARQSGDAKAFAATLATYGKYTRLDRDEGNVPDYSSIVPQDFTITSDPTVAGFKRIPNVEEKARKLLARYIKDVESPQYYPAEEVKPLRPEFNGKTKTKEL